MYNSVTGALEDENPYPDTKVPITHTHVAFSLMLLKYLE